MRCFVPAQDVLGSLGQIALGGERARAGELPPLGGGGSFKTGSEQLFDRRQAGRGQGVHQAMDVFAAGHGPSVAEPAVMSRDVARPRDLRTGEWPEVVPRSVEL